MTDYETQPVHGRTDHRHPEGTGGRLCDRGCVPQAQKKSSRCGGGAGASVLWARGHRWRPQETNQRWSLDFVADAFSDGRRCRILTVADDFTRECLALVADWKDDYNHARPHSHRNRSKRSDVSRAGACLSPACHQRPLRASKPHGPPPITGGNFGLRSSPLPVLPRYDRVILMPLPTTGRHTV